MRRRASKQVWVDVVRALFVTLAALVTITTIYKLRQLVPDERIPGAMLVGHTLPVAAQAFAFIPR